MSDANQKNRRLYGVDQKHCAHFATQCLMARRLVERGVRFVQIYSGGMDNQLSWDCHADLIGNHRGFALETDQPVAALLEDCTGAVCSTKRWWSGAASSGGCRCRKKVTNPAETITRMRSLSGWRAAACEAIPLRRNG